MLKKFALTLLCATPFLGMAQDQKEPWLNPLVNRVNCEAPRSPFFAFESEQLAEAGCKSQGYQVMTVLPLTLSNNLLMQGMI